MKNAAKERKVNTRGENNARSRRTDPTTGDTAVMNVRFFLPRGYDNQRGQDLARKMGLRRLATVCHLSTRSRYTLFHP